LVEAWEAARFDFVIRNFFFGICIQYLDACNKANLMRFKHVLLVHPFSPGNNVITTKYA